MVDPGRYLVGKARDVEYLDSCMDEAYLGLLNLFNPLHCTSASLGYLRCPLVNPVKQVVKPGTLRGMLGPGVSVGQGAAALQKHPLQGVDGLRPAVLSRDVGLVVGKMPRASVVGEGWGTRRAVRGKDDPRCVELGCVQVAQLEWDGDLVHLVPQGVGTEEGMGMGMGRAWAWAWAWAWACIRGTTLEDGEGRRVKMGG